MADGDYYASYADVQKLLMNAGIGVADNTMFDDDAIELALKISQARIHLKIGLPDTLTSITGAVYAEVLKGIQIHQILQRIIAARHCKDQNLASIEVLNTFWTLSPQFTIQQREDLKEIKRKYHGLAIANYDIRTGARI